MTPQTQPEKHQPQTRGSEIYEGLKARLISHEFRMGDPLREEDVATWFGASRVPARDALKRLESEGLVERVGRKYAVRNYSYDEVEVTYRIRAALEHLAVDRLVKSARDEDLDRIAHVLDRQSGALASSSRAEFSALDADFHMLIAELSQNSMLVAETRRVLDRVRLIRSNELERDNGPAAALADHQRIFAALARRDGATAKAELDFHYATTLRLHEITPTPKA
ncbi:GntR family transcriptional regulator [Thioclava kandeliae]|uniref:GntR family transcriptional regulator n=1 Tax=Thioclava kandeliae TaxID=3070818 RepID=A0ABV1SHK3_9RHOB